ncbi:hypothetical protein J8281_18300 [Aquimarina sp. U1-2]|uniref:hypothetical protein n=1 Tax=Aquimarina sp. U1-2 TaxID=2823141 RepID=UPI001AEC96E7|nr:hypothetical protein [Aquimarina sp. U1-2]MBP2834155.1 hypothetical protein [Aquimarina sp. U1-2]
MRTILMLFVFHFLISCAREVPPTVENINKIFDSKDFTFEFHNNENTCQSISFRNDYLVFKSDLPTVRREITYEEVLLINDFIQKIVNVHSDSLSTDDSSYYVIQNTAYKTVIIPHQEEYYFEALLKTLRLK